MSIVARLDLQHSESRVETGQADRFPDTLVLISVVRNESDSIRRVAESVSCQTFKPRAWLVVDDGSTDGTYEILEELQEKMGFLQIRRFPMQRSDGFFSLGRAVKFALDCLDKQHPRFDYLGILDGDTILPYDYYEKAIQRFERDPSLMALSGKLSYLVGGREFKTSGGSEKRPLGCCLVLRKHILDVCVRDDLPDTSLEDYVNAKAKMRGYRVRTFDSKVLHIGPDASLRRKEKEVIRIRGQHLAYYGFPAAYVALLSVEFMLRGFDARSFLQGYLDFRRRKRRVRDSQVWFYYSRVAIFRDNRFWDLSA